MPASKTKEVVTPKFRESILSALIRDTVGDGRFGPDWANSAPQGLRKKMRDYRGPTSLRKQDRGTMMERSADKPVTSSRSGTMMDRVIDHLMRGKPRKQP